MATSDFTTAHLNGKAKELADAIVDYITAQLGEAPDGGGCKAFYAPKEWAARGERYGHDAVLVLVHDGGDLALYCNPDYDLGASYTVERFNAVLKARGYYIELCTGWYSAVYAR
jgi:hypothetical protein